MKFAVLYEYVPDISKIGEIRPAHRQYLNQLLASGNLVAAGPITDDSGALIIYEAESAEQAQSFIENDPFHKSGIFLRWQVKPWKMVFGNHSLIPNGGPS